MSYALGAQNNGGKGTGGKEKAPIPLPQGVAVRTPLSNIWTHMKLEKRMSVD